MKRMKRWFYSLLFGTVLTATTPATYAQVGGPLLIIQGTPDTASAPPLVQTYVSLIDPTTAEAIPDIPPEQFSVWEAGTPVDNLAVAYRPVGLAIVVVIDRGASPPQATPACAKRPAWYGNWWPAFPSPEPWRTI